MWNDTSVVLSYACWDANRNKVRDWTRMKSGQGARCDGASYMRVDYQCSGCPNEIRTYVKGCHENHHPYTTFTGDNEHWQYVIVCKED